MAKRKIKKRKIFYLILGILLLISIFLNTYLLLKYKVLPTKYLSIYVVLVGIIPIIMIMYTLFKKRKSKIKGVIAGIEILYIIVLFILFFYLNSTFNFLDKFTKDLGYETKQYIVLVLKDSEYKDIKDLKGKKIAYTNGLDTSVDNAVKELEKKIDFNSEKTDGYGEAFTNLDNKNIDGLLLTNSYYETLIEDDENDSYSKYFTIYKFNIKEKTEQVIKEVDVTSEPFNVYITGIDTFGDITEQKRSDVNIIMSVNPKTHNILLINIPRDYYVEIAGKGVKDKITHAGIAGVETSIKTIEKLLETDINYYVKVNFNAVVKLVDALGGVDVYSEYDFRSTEYNYHFIKGNNKVNGLLALDFVRTRKAFLQGDRVRGENQQRMIQALINKITSPSILIKYDALLKALDGCFVTNIPMDNITSIINYQLSEMQTWEFSTFSLNGSDDYVITSSGNNMYIMIPKEETIQEAKQMIKENSQN